MASCGFRSSNGHCPECHSRRSESHPGRSNPLAGAAGMSLFRIRSIVLKSYSDKPPLEYVTEWRMQKAMQLLQHRDKKLIERRSVGRLRVRRCVQQGVQAGCRSQPLVNTASNAVFEDQGHAGNGGRFLKRRILTLRDPGAMEILPLKWAPEVPRTPGRETADPKPTEADRDQSR